MDWFRYHATVINNRRVQKIEPRLFKAWVNCMSIASLEQIGKSGRMPIVEDCAYYLHLSPEDTQKLFLELCAVGLMYKAGDKAMDNAEGILDGETKDETSNPVSVKQNTAFHHPKNATEFETFHLFNWGKKQYKSDLSTDRVRKHRNGKRNGLDQIRSDTDQNRSDGDHSLNDSGDEVSGAKLKPKTYNIDRFLKDEDRAQFRKELPGIDMQTLMVDFNDWIVNKNKAFPAHPGRAFIAWSKTVTNKRK